MDKTKKISIITSSILIVLLIASIIVASLAWFTSSVIDDLSVYTNNYIILYFDGDIGYLDKSGNYSNPSDNTVALSAREAGLNEIRDNKTNTTIKATTAGSSAVVKIVDYSGNKNTVYEKLALRASIRAFAVDENDVRTEISTSTDICITPKFTIKYNGEGSESNIIETSSNIKHNQYHDFSINKRNGELRITLEAYLRAVDELAIPAVLNAKQISIELTIRSLEATRTLYYYNANAWENVYAYGLAVETQPITSTKNAWFVVGYNGDVDNGLIMKKDADTTSLRTDIFAYYGYRWRSSNDDFVITNGKVSKGIEGVSDDARNLSDGTVISESAQSGRITLSNPGLYNIFYDSKNDAITIETSNNPYKTFDSELLGAFPGTAMSPVNGLAGWYSITVPVGLQQIVFTDGNNKKELIDIDPTKCYYYTIDEGEETWNERIRDFGNRIYCYIPTSSAVSVKCTNYKGDVASYPMTPLNNGWFYTDIDKSLYQLENLPSTLNVDFIVDNKVYTTTTEIDAGKPYFYNNNWYASPDCR